MAFFRKSHGPVLRTITIGKPWRIDGEPIEANDAQTALREIYDAHELFPVFIDVENPSGQVLHLTMDENGVTSQREHDESAEEQRDLATDVLQGPGAKGHEHQELDEPEIQELANADESDPAVATVAAGVTKKPVRRWPRTPLVIAGATVVFIGLGTLGVNALAQDDEGHPGASSEAPAPEQTVTLAEGVTPLWLSDRVAIIDDGGTVRLVDPATGDQIGDDITADPGKIRAMSSEAGDVITTGEGQFIIYDGQNEPQAYTGTLNLRGSQPVAVDGREFRTMNEPEKGHEAPEDAAVFGATEEGVVMAKAPAFTVVADTENDMGQPHDDAEVVEWVQAGEEAYALLWSPEGDGETVLALHDPDTGEVMSRTEVSEDEVNVNSGTVSLGDDRYLEGTEIKDLCDGGMLIGGTPVCPSEGDEWKSAGGDDLAGKPRALSDSYYITQNNEIRKIGQ